MSTGSWAANPSVRKAMQGNRRKDTAPEMAVRRLLHAAGLRYRVDQAVVPGLNRRGDMVFRRARVVVFIDGCFWHQCPSHFREPGMNAEFWKAKIGGNVARDRETDKMLTDHGWTVLRFWEHEDPQDVAVAVERAVRGAAEPPARV